MDLLTLITLIVVVLLIIAGFIVFYAKQYRKVGPNEVMIISGGKKNTITLPDGSQREIGFRYRIGGGAFVNPMTERVERLPIEVVPVHGKIVDVLSHNGIPITVEYSAQVKINMDEYPLYLAITNFLNKGSEGILDVSSKIMENKVREVVGLKTVEQMFTERNEFAERVITEAGKELEKLGLMVMSFGLRDISDSQGYLDALSMPHITQAKYEAEVDQAEKDRDMTIKSAEARKEGEVARLAAEAEIAKATWINEAKKAESQVDVNAKKARADMAYELERFKLQEELKRKEYAVKKVELQEATKLEELGIVKKQKELEANIIKPAEARKFQIQTEAEAESYRIKTEAEGKLKAQKAEKQLEAESLREMGKAEAEALAEKAKAYESYSQAAVYQMIMEKMPELASAVAEPLSKVDKIVMIENDGKLGSSKLTGQVAEILSQLPEVVESLTGADLKAFLKKKLNKEE